MRSRLALLWDGKPSLALPPFLPSAYFSPVRRRRKKRRSICSCLGSTAERVIRPQEAEKQVCPSNMMHLETWSGTTFQQIALKSIIFSAIFMTLWMDFLSCGKAQPYHS
ncbi:unnamed protein product [Leuciscus chuanchicus]